MAITAETLRIAEQLRRQVGFIVDGVTRSLTAAWVRAWDEVVFDLAAAITELLQIGDGRWPTRRQIERTSRAMRALDIVGASLERLATLTRSQTATAAAEAARVGLQGQGDLVASQLPYGSTQALAARYRAQQPDTIDAIVRRTAEQINAAHWPLADEATEAMKRELVRGVVVGDNPRTAAARMVKNLEGEFNGGLTRALNLARTETLDAHRQAAEIGQEQHGDVLEGWVWHAELNSSRGRTCPSCWALHGKVFPLSVPGPIDHQQGRCSRTPKTKSWADLGFDIDEPDDLIPDARQVFNDLPESEQVAIMGRRRLDLLTSGDISWDDLSELRTTDGWRDSYGVRSVKDLERIASGRQPEPQTHVTPRPAPQPAPAPASEPMRAVPEDAQPYHRTLDGIEDLADLVESGPPDDRRPLGGGAVAEVELLTYPDGRQVVRKTARPGSGGTQEAASEQLASLVARTLGLPAPGVYRNSDDAIFMEYVAGKTAQEIMGWGGDLTPDLRAAIDSNEGALLGLFDVLIFNWDRNAGNWLLDDRGRLVPIDHGVAWTEMPSESVESLLEYIQSPFADRVTGDTNPFTKADIAEVRQRLEGLRADFDHLGHGSWIDYGMQVLDLLADRARGRRNLIAKVR
ncbi:hypothetical protein ACIBK9_47160 [Nonomuraea sp. NPDC050227]|uniref:hypothetical protein n=1 Tax=Nonomuraea sp. NPDC050227 TaxID=3364360 RepID=UPI00379FAD7C